MISRCYLEITNRCNLDCLFCPKTDRKKQQLTLEEFDLLTNRLLEKVRFLYFHLMGEPMLHPHLPLFVRMARQKGFIPVLTTNGTLWHHAEKLIKAHPHKVQISLHSHEGNGKEHLEEYINHVMRFAQEASEKGIIIVLRLWNEGGYNTNNELLLELIAHHQPRPWTARHDGWKLAPHLYIEHDHMFQWPDNTLPAYDEQKIFCYALRNQIGVLVDGSVVPCCLDHAGELTLGNLFKQPLDEILSSSRAQAIYNGFTHHTAVETLCQRCGYAAVTKRFRE